MNIQSGKVRGSAPRRKQGGSFGGKLAAAFRIAMILALAGGLANVYIYLNQKIAETEREIRTTRNDIHNTEREIDNLRIRREHFRAWPHIRQAIARFDLKLQPADPRQVRKLVIIPPALAPQVSVASRAPADRESRRTTSSTRWSQR